MIYLDEKDKNPIRNIIIYFLTMTTNVDFTNSETSQAFYLELSDTIANLVNDNEYDYLDFDIYVDKYGDLFEFEAHNLITALWFSGIFPKNIKNVQKNDYYKVYDKIYTFDEEKNKLIVTKTI